MSKNRIISQMFDVRPVDETGDLDWKKIQSVGGWIQCVGDEPCSGERNSQIEIGQIDSFVKSDQNLIEMTKLKNALTMEERIQEERAKQERKLLQINQQNKLIEEREAMRVELETRMLAERARHEFAIKAEKEKNDHLKRMLLEAEKMRLEQQQKEVLEKINNLHKEKEAEIIAQKEAQQQKRQEAIRLQAHLRQKELKRITENNRKKQSTYEKLVLIEKKRREKEDAEWLEKEMRLELKARKLQLAIDKKNKKREKSKKKWSSGNTDHEFFWRDIIFPANFAFQFDGYKSLKAFVAALLIISMSLGSVAYASKGLGLKERVFGSSTDGLDNLNSAISDIANQNFDGSSQNLDKAFANFSQSSDELESMGGMLFDATRFIPFASKLSSGKNAVSAGKHFSAAGKYLNEVAKFSAKLKGSSAENHDSTSLLDIFNVASENIVNAKKELDLAQQNIDKISIEDLPEDKRDKFLLVKQKLPDLIAAMDLFLNNSHIVADLLGANGPRKYLFLFQNNTEMRATGGFIGSYGLLDIANGHVKKFFIDGIFNPDGQLREKIVPPAPIQKISSSWSLHDSNWFADFPVSAKKAIQFYEKTGGPTVDGVITFTPTVMQKLLKITGPIELPEYDVTLDSNNFIELTQYKVEVDYDKEENKPKKILSDLAPLVLEKLFSSKDLDVISKTAQALLEGLREKHILLYSENGELQEMISKQGWSGEIIKTPKDYISVINTNVNGFKTDAVIEERIDHHTDIQEDGSIVDTVTITRKHNGGDAKYEWLNKVNADYMRVYVPEGSKLLEVSGQTREINEPPLDYNALGFNRDENVQKEEAEMTIDDASGTRIYNEAGKTVFANWTYVSPHESMSITYKYVLPFALFKVSVSDKRQADSYSLVVQKQSGSVGSSFSSQISFPDSYGIVWSFPTTGESSEKYFKNENTLTTDQFIGMVFESK